MLAIGCVLSYHTTEAQNTPPLFSVIDQWYYKVIRNNFQWDIFLKFQTLLSWDRRARPTSHFTLILIRPMSVSLVIYHTNAGLFYYFGSPYLSTCRRSYVKVRKTSFSIPEMCTVKLIPPSSVERVNFLQEAPPNWTAHKWHAVKFQDDLGR